MLQLCLPTVFPGAHKLPSVNLMVRWRSGLLDSFVSHSICTAHHPSIRGGKVAKVPGQGRFHWQRTIPGGLWQVSSHHPQSQGMGAPAGCSQDGHRTRPPHHIIESKSQTVPQGHKAALSGGKADTHSSYTPWSTGHSLHSQLIRA